MLASWSAAKCAACLTSITEDRMPNAVARILGLCLSGLVAWPGTTVAAQPGWYIGAAFGGSTFDMDELSRKIDADLVLTSGVASSSTTTRDDSDSGIKGYFGYNFSRFVGVEIGYVNLGEAILQTITTTPDDLFIGAAEVHGWHAGLVANIPLAFGFSVHAKAGPFAWKQEVLLPSTASTNAVAGKSDGFDWTAGAGISYEAVKGVSIRVEFERFQVDDDEVDYISSGLLFSF
jgi:opacity protein-like surface antigen